MDSIVAPSAYFAPSGQSAIGGDETQGVALGYPVLAFQAGRLHGSGHDFVTAHSGECRGFSASLGRVRERDNQRLSNRRNSFRNGVLSCQVRAVTRLPSTTHGRSTYLAPAVVASSGHLATQVTRRPPRHPAAASISTPAQTEATGCFVPKKSLAVSTRCLL